MKLNPDCIRDILLYIEDLPIWTTHYQLIHMISQMSCRLILKAKLCIM